MIENIIKAIENMMKEKRNEVAIVYDGIQYTYEDLDYMTYKIALYLQSKEIATEDIVAIYMERSWLSVCATIGVLRTGAAFLPIDTKTPISRLERILEISKAKVIFCDRDVSVSKDIDRKNINHLLAKKYESRTLKNVRIDQNTLAYVIFTSGTTGEPKGVMIEHGGLCNHISEKIRLLKLDGQSVIAHNASIGFDISVWQILAPLCCGGKIVIFSEKSVLQISKFYKILEEEKVTVLELVPTYLNLLINSCPSKGEYNNLKYVISTGQELTRALVDRWFSVFPDVPLVNAYGPTEASDDIAHCIITKVDKYANIPIGMPISNSKFSIKLEDNSNEKGELLVSGICVGRGYIGNEEETRKFFLVDEYTGERIYRTGDLVSKSEDGKYFYHGRIDQQIKLHGYRIEIGEIENCIMSYEGINEVAVLYKKESEELCAFVTSENPIDLKQLKIYLQDRILYYMIPAVFLQTPKIPVDMNGKTDTRKLMKMLSDDKNSINEKNEKIVCNLIKDIMKLQELPEDESWKSDLTIIGMESLTAIQLIVSIEEAFGFEFDEKDLNLEVIYNFYKICKCIPVQKDGV